MTSWRHCLLKASCQVGTGRSPDERGRTVRDVRGIVSGMAQREVRLQASCTASNKCQGLHASRNKAFSVEC